MWITSGRVTVKCHTRKDVEDCCKVLGTGSWTEADIDLFEKLVEQGVLQAEAMRKVDEARRLKAS